MYLLSRLGRRKCAECLALIKKFISIMNQKMMGGVYALPWSRGLDTTQKICTEYQVKVLRGTEHTRIEFYRIHDLQ